MTVSLLIIESYEVSPDAADQAIALFDQVSHLVGIPADASSPLGLAPASVEPSSSVGRAITPWLLSLSLNITCVLLILWQQWWQRSIDPSTQSDGPHAHGRVRRTPRGRGHLGAITRFNPTLSRGPREFYTPHQYTCSLGPFSVPKSLRTPVCREEATPISLPEPRLSHSSPQFGVEVTADVASPSFFPGTWPHG
jgi:Family of unknown function (DUF6535)